MFINTCSEKYGLYFHKYFLHYFPHTSPSAADRLPFLKMGTNRVLFHDDGIFPWSRYAWYRSVTAGAISTATFLSSGWYPIRSCRRMRLEIFKKLVDSCAWNTNWLHVRNNTFVKVQYWLFPFVGKNWCELPVQNISLHLWITVQHSTFL